MSGVFQMLKHGRAGVPMEVMGLMLGEFVDDYTVRVIDVFAMPQSGTVSNLTLCQMGRAVEIPCPTCPTWSHFIQDKLKISNYLSLDNYKSLKLIQFCVSYFD